MPAYSKVLAKGSCYIYTRRAIPIYFKITIDINKFFKNHSICEICKNEKTAMVLINNGVFVGVCYGCGDGITVNEVIEESAKRVGSNGKPKKKKAVTENLVFV